MLYAIGNIIYLKSAVIVGGWCERLAHLRLTINGQEYVPLVEEVERPDLASAFGEHARNWGFMASVLVAGLGSTPQQASLTINRAGGEEVTIDLMKMATERAGSQHELANKIFFDELRSANTPRVLEIGSRARSGVVRRTMFGDKCVGVDVVAGENVDIVVDAHFLSEVVNGPFDFVYSSSTFEHLIMPWKAVLEINKVLRVGGLVFTQAPQAWPLHDEPWDFFRFSADAWRGLFNKASGFEVLYAGYGDPAIITPAFNTGSPVTAIDGFFAPLSSFCTARKVGEATVDFALSRTDYDSILGNKIYPG